ncbi:MAG: GIY-YIG nuclease family protein [Firmicutes bacterium]|nr:GIY-YIG nuclease family protein [Bacillota bacterium]
MLLKEIIKMRGLDKYNIKIVRHTVKRKYIERLINNGDFEMYQSVQKSDVFKNCDYILTFIATEGTNSILHGVYKVRDVKKIDKLPKQINFIKEYENWSDDSIYKYSFEEVDILKDLEKRLVIDWGSGVLSWHQRILEKRVVEILPKGFVKGFPGYQNVILSFEELERIINNPIPNRQWKMALSSVYGVYLILDKKDGKQYIGSAYGEEGIWGRWKTYVKTKHGNNKILTEIINEDSERYRNFQFSILDILPKTSVSEDVIELENTMKKKLGSKVFGLNMN